MPAFEQEPHEPSHSEHVLVPDMDNVTLFSSDIHAALRLLDEARVIHDSIVTVDIFQGCDGKNRYADAVRFAAGVTIGGLNAYKRYRAETNVHKASTMLGMDLRDWLKK